MMSSESKETATGVPTDVATLNVAGGEHSGHATRFRPHDQVAVILETVLLERLLQILDAAVSAGQLGEGHHFSSPFPIQ